MATEGELVRMQNGRWARYQALQIRNAGLPEDAGAGRSTILVAVELDERFQELLAAAETALIGRGTSEAPQRTLSMH